jgi:predicted RNA methylase
MTQLDLIEGTTRDLTKSQYFTPPKLAAKVVEWANIWLACEPKPRVLEPSAGNGALVRPLVAAGAEVTAIELDERYREELKALTPGRVWIDNFLDFKPYETLQADLCVMNPPYHDNLCAEFIVHALKFAPRVVAILQADVFYTATRFEALWKHTRPTKAAFCVRRPWKGAETDYVVVEFVTREAGMRWADALALDVRLEWWADSWF